MTDESIERICTKCGETKPLKDYNNAKGGKYGKKAECKECASKRRKITYDKSKQKGAFDYPINSVKVCNICKIEKVLTEFTPSKQKKYGRESTCKACMAIRGRKHRLENKEACLERERTYREGHREKLRTYGASWWDKNAEKIKENRRNRYKHNASFRLRRNFLRYVRAKIRLGAAWISWDELFDFTLEQLMAQLESMFKPGMSWENYGVWQVDHIRPISSFDIKAVNDSSFKECWSLSNLQPLWSTENQTKSAKIMVQL
jgi:hypothetical protein